MHNYPFQGDKQCQFRYKLNVPNPQPIKTVQRKPIEINSKQSLLVSRYDKDVRRRSVFKGRQRICNQQKTPKSIEENQPKLFSLDNVIKSSDQIHQFAEQMIQETSNQIKNEKTLEKILFNGERTLSPQENKIQFPKNNKSHKDKLTCEISDSFQTELEKSTSISSEKFANKEMQKFIQNNPQEQTQTTVSNVEIEIIKSSAMNLQQPPLQNAVTPDKTNIKVSSKSKPTINSVSNLNTTSNTANNNSVKKCSARNEPKHGANINIKTSNAPVRKEKSTTYDEPKSEASLTKKASNICKDFIKAEKYLHKGSNIPKHYMNLTKV